MSLLSSTPFLGLNDFLCGEGNREPSRNLASHHQVRESYYALFVCFGP